jgi:iron(III) transport system substrate-binding protein
LESTGEVLGKVAAEGDHPKFETALTNKKLSGLPSGGVLNKQLLTGNAKVGIAQDSATFAKAAGGEPLIEVYPTEGVVATPSSIAIGAKSPRADAARKFLELS